MQNLVLLIEKSKNSWSNSWKGGNMMMNLFCIDEDAAHEISGKYNLKKSPAKSFFDNSRYESDVNEKGNENKVFAQIDDQIDAKNSFSD